MESWTKYTDERVKRQGESYTASQLGRVGHSQSLETRVKISESMKKNAREGKLKGFMKRGKESYPEKFWSAVLDNNGIPYIREYRVSFTSLGVNNSHAGYFLDFFIKDLNLDLEIDGSQHRWNTSVREKDKIRDERLKSRSYLVYRIPYIDPRYKDKVKKQIDDFLEYYNSLIRDPLRLPD